MYEDDYDPYEYADAYEDSFGYDEPDLDFGFEHDSAMTSVGWGTDEDYGYYGDEDAAMESGLWGDDC